MYKNLRNHMKTDENAKNRLKCKRTDENLKKQIKTVNT